jgi:hypothetical protein
MAGVAYEHATKTFGEVAAVHDFSLDIQDKEFLVSVYRAIQMIKLRLQELLHRELSYSGIIDEKMSYSATPLAAVGIENGRNRP